MSAGHLWFCTLLWSVHGLSDAGPKWFLWKLYETMNMEVFCNLQRWSLWSLPLPRVPPTEKDTHTMMAAGPVLSEPQWPLPLALYGEFSPYHLNLLWLSFPLWPSPGFPYTEVDWLSHQLTWLCLYLLMCNLENLVIWNLRAAHSSTRAFPLFLLRRRDFNHPFLL